MQETTVGRTYTWEEVSFMTGVAIEHLLEIYRERVLHISLFEEARKTAMPMAIDSATLAEVQAGLPDLLCA